MKFQFLLALAFSVLFSCKKDKSPSDPISPDPTDTIPIVLVDTVPFCHIALNGNPWTPSAFGCKYYKTAHETGKSLNFYMGQFDSTGSYPLSYFYLSRIERKLGRQKLEIYRSLYPKPSAWLVFYDVDVPDKTYKVDTSAATTESFLDLTKIDTVNNLVEGNFESSMIWISNPDPDGVVTIFRHFQDGKFRIKYTVH